MASVIDGMTSSAAQYAGGGYSFMPSDCPKYLNWFNHQNLDFLLRRRNFIIAFHVVSQAFIGCFDIPNGAASQV